MLIRTTVPAASDASTLRALLNRPSGLCDEAVAEARSAGVEVAGALVAELIHAGLSRPLEDGTAVRAAHLAGELRLTRALPALIRCIEELLEFHPLRSAALIAIDRFGSTAVDALVTAFARCRSREARARIAEALSGMDMEDERVRGVFLGMLEEDPAISARFFGGRGDWRALEHLYRAIDRIVRGPPACCELCSDVHLRALVSAIPVLGGTLSERQRAEVDAMLERARAGLRFDGEKHVDATAEAIVVRTARLGRNDPCHCGSGKKYKRCHLGADERAMQ